MSKIQVRNAQGAAAGEVELADHLLVSGRGEAAVHDAIVRHLNNVRQGTASTKNRGEVSGSNRKPWAQKGTGRARAGEIRSPIWRKGGIIFGPKPRDFNQDMPRKKSRLAFRRALGGKIEAGEVTVLDGFVLPGHKTREVAALLKRLELADRTVLLVTAAHDANLLRATRNLANVTLTTADQAHTYQVLRNRHVVIAREALTVLEQRLAKAAGESA
jgi:large subunit ribosomal protein L4